MEDFDVVRRKFWETHKPQPEDYWQIETEIVQQGDKRWVRASIVYVKTTIVTAHSDDFDPQDTHTAEKLAIYRAIKLLP